MFDKLGAALPIAMTALATVFAGMSSSELQRAMFWRTAAGQDQAKATNQWTFAGLKRNRSLTMEGAATLMGAQTGLQKASFPAPSGNAPPEEKEAAEWLAGKGPPRESLPKIEDENIKAVTKAIRDREPEEEILKKAAKVSPKSINKAIDDAEKAFESIDSKWDKVLKAAGEIVKKRSKVDSKDPEAVKEAIAVQAARLDMEQRRYRAESALTFGLGFLYDARVRVVTAVSDHHRKRSENFFYAMLVAQIGAVISSLALARKQKSALWLLAGLAGLTALGFGGFVYLTV